MIVRSITRNKSFTEWISIAAVLVATKIMKRMEVVVLRRISALKESLFLKRENLALQDLVCEQILQILRAALAVYTYVLKDGLIVVLFFRLICERNVPVVLLKGVWFFQFVLDKLPPAKQTP